MKAEIAVITVITVNQSGQYISIISKMVTSNNQ